MSQSVLSEVSRYTALQYPVTKSVTLLMQSLYNGARVHGTYQAGLGCNRDYLHMPVVTRATD